MDCFAWEHTELLNFSVVELKGLLWFASSGKPPSTAIRPSVLHRTVFV